MASAERTPEAGSETLPSGTADAPAVVEPEFVEPTSELTELARAYGVAVEYWDQSGKYHRVGAATIKAVLTALGLDVSTPDAVWHSLYARRNESWRRMLPPVFVSRSGQDSQCWVHVPNGEPVRMWIDLEQGGPAWFIDQVDRWVEPRHVDGVLVGEAAFRVPWDLPLGWHRMWARSEGSDGVVRESSCPLVVTPARLESPALAAGRQWGFMTQVYSMRSQGSWGIGDLVDLAELAAWSGHADGADFVLVNPLHAASPIAPMEPSPYLPVTRRFANPIYLRVEAVEEYANLSADDRASIEALAAPVKALSKSADLIDRDVIWAAKSEALGILFRAPLSAGRQARFEAFVDREGEGLVDFATWCALVDEYGPDSAAWPAGLADARSEAVAAQRDRLADRVRWHQWLQWQLDEQLTRAQQAARDAGMRSGIVHDLAVGVHSRGSDAWAMRDVLARGVSVGAPPDVYNQMGQNWSQPPWNPEALAEAAFVPYRDMLRTVLRHAGGIRIDHVLGLFRLWWVPDGMPAYSGTYVTCDHEALVGILALEAQRAGALLVGEDLGTVEQWVQDYLAARGILGTTIIWFERDYTQKPDIPRQPEQWRPNCLASVTVHDLPPTAGYLAGEHVRIRGELGLLTKPADEELAESNAQIAEWRQICVERGWLDEDGDDEDLIEALHRLLAASPSVLLGVALTDAVGDRRAQNQPGTDQEYPNWRVPLTDAAGRPVLIEDLPSFALLRRLVDAVKGQGLKPAKPRRTQVAEPATTE
ncbi:MAG: 4-alpha-glucanotransferase [Candidatus Nanopelagicales bacterium]